MAIPLIRFNPPYDVHLLRGQSFQVISDGMALPNGTPFVNLLQIGFQSPGRYVDDHPTHQYRFRFSFDEHRAADFGIQISNPIADPRKPDCLITLNANEPASPKNRIRNFYIFVSVSDTANPSDSNETALRVHIHNSIAEVWITPNPLTIYNGLFYRSELFARFDDGVVARIGNSIFRGNRAGGFRYNINPAIDIQWESDTPDLIDTVFDSIRPKGRFGTHKVRATVSYNGVQRQASADVIISETLTHTSPIRAELVPMGAGPGFSKLDSVPNILFLSEGFTADQDMDFRYLVSEYVYDLMSKKITAPFHLLRGSINFWMVFIPSREAGVNTLGERRVFENTGPIGLPELKGTLIPFIENPGGQSVSDWDIRNLLYFTGLPAKSEKTIPMPALAEKWKATTNLSDDQVDDLLADRSDLVENWLTYAERRLPEVPDTVFGITVNDYTAACKDEEFNLINLDSKRSHREYLDDFFDGLQDTAGNLIGHTFIKVPEVTTHPTLPRGKDWDHIVILTATNRGRAQNEDGYMFSIIGSNDVDEYTGDLTQNRVSLKPLSMPFKLPNGAKSTMTHEICHSFGLGDEYGEPVPFGSYDRKPVTHADVSNWNFARYTGPGGALDSYSNIQSRADLVIPGSENLQAFRIKWRYHRIRTCGIVKMVAVQQTTLTLTLEPGQTNGFAAGQPVFVRKRKRDETAYILKTSADAPISVILDPDPVPPALMNRPTITGVNAAVDQVTIRSEVSIGSGNFTNTVLTLERGKATALQVGQTVKIGPESRPGPIYTLFRSDNGALESKALSPLLTISRITPGTDQLELTIPGDFPDYLKTVSANDAMIVYRPLDAPEAHRSANYPHSELISPKVLTHLLPDAAPFNTDSDKREIIDQDTQTRIPGHLVPCCSRREKEIIGLYAGGRRYHGGVYHPAAQCMMRHHLERNRYVELCAVCRYTLINLIDPTQFSAFDTDYMNRKIYPE